MGVVYYGSYFVWFEVARTEYLRGNGLAYRDLEREGIYMMVARASCEYAAPALYDDLLTVEAAIGFVKNSSFSFIYRILRDDAVIARGESVHVMTNAARKPVRIPDSLRAILTPAP